MTVQCPACLNYALEGLFYCPCGVRHVPSPEQKTKIKTQFEIMSVPFHTVREDDSRGAKHGVSQWQYYQWKARNATKGAKKRGKGFIVQRWKEDETYRRSLRNDKSPYTEMSPRRLRGMRDSECRRR